MEWNGCKVLVTGGAGFLGANLCHGLAARGALVTALDGFLFGGGANAANLDGAKVELVRGDIREIDLRPLCEGVAVIFNLAAQTSHMGGQLDPLADIAVNAVAQVRLIQAAREAAPDAVVVHASTRQFYGRAERLPVDENHPVAPPDANGVSKFAGEQYWMIEHRVQGRPVVSLRLTNCYGPRLRIRDARQTFLGIWIRCVLEGTAVRGVGRRAVARPDLCGRRDRGVPVAAAENPDLPRPHLQPRRRPAGLAARYRRTDGAAVRWRPRATPPASSPPTAPHRHRQLPCRRQRLPRRHRLAAGGRVGGGHRPLARLVPARLADYL